MELLLETQGAQDGSSAAATGSLIGEQRAIITDLASATSVGPAEACAATPALPPLAGKALTGKAKAAKVRLNARDMEALQPDAGNCEAVRPV